jgi:hypothetical protein
MKPDPLPLRTRWLALTAATIALQFSYWAIVAGASADPDSPEALETGVGMLAFGLALVPFVFLVLTFATRHPRAPTATLKGMGLFLLIGLPVGLVNPAIGAAVGFSAGGVVGLRTVEGVDTRRARWVAVLALAFYLGALVFLGTLLPALGGFALMSGAVLPFAVHGLVDQALAERADARRERDGSDPHLSGDPDGS